MKRKPNVLAVPAIALFIVFSNAQSSERERPNVAILIFNGVQPIDFAGPFEVFGQLNLNNVFTIGENLEPITTSMGMIVTPNYSFDNSPVPDVIVIPGGGGVDVRGQVNNQKTLEWIQENAKTAKYVLSVCNGAFVIAKAGLLDGKEATTFYGLLSNLKKDYPHITVVYNKRFVDNGKVITTAGISSGIDGALHVVSLLHGAVWAKAVSLNMEYNWQPDSKYARAMLADMNIPNGIYKFLGQDAELLEYTGDTVMWKERWNIGSGTFPDTVLNNVNRVLSEDQHWTRVESKISIGKEGNWKFSDRFGKQWSATIRIEHAEQKNRFLFTLNLSRQEDRH